MGARRVDQLENNSRLYRPLSRVSQKVFGTAAKIALHFVLWQEA